MNQPLRTALIGAGMVSRLHLIAWANIPDQASLMAIADLPPDNLQTLRLIEDCYRLSGWEASR